MLTGRLELNLGMVPGDVGVGQNQIHLRRTTDCERGLGCNAGLFPAVREEQSKRL
jgi:hypothetical protein